jgi:hypothetical protein
LSCYDQLQTVKFKGVGIWLSRLELCVSETGATIGVECFSAMRGKTERGIAKVFDKKKENTRNSSLDVN